MPMEIFLIAGEPSGDALGAELIKSLKASAPNKNLRFVGVGGRLMKDAGMDVILPLDELSVMGLAEIIPQIPRLLGLIGSIRDEILRRKPAALVTIDFPDFNFILGKSLKKAAKKKKMAPIPHIHYVAPTVWAWRAGRAKKIAKFLDGLICILPFEPPYFQRHGLSCVFAGHPIMNECHACKDSDKKKMRNKHGISDDTKILGLLMGSRHGEVNRCGDIITKAAVFVREKQENLHLVVPTLPSLEYEVTSFVAGTGLDATVVTDAKSKMAALSCMDAAIAVSGTVGLELSALSIPHVIAYRASPITWRIGKFMTKIKYAHLANIVLDEDLVPEYLQKDCEPEALAQGVLKLLSNEDWQATAQIDGFKRLREKFTVHGDGGTVAAQFILDRART